mmetsp:Transcript_6153/g.10728  ORF Transcript_6153/g.10728 Transcript_6153/m.10728 type:complete len:88 (+) Transcript_6153:304-567(+)
MACGVRPYHETTHHWYGYAPLGLTCGSHRRQHLMPPETQRITKQYPDIRSAVLRLFCLHQTKADSTPRKPYRVLREDMTDCVVWDGP